MKFDIYSKCLLISRNLRFLHKPKTLFKTDQKKLYEPKRILSIDGRW